MPERHHSRLIIKAKDNGGGYTACWVETDAQESEPFDFKPPLTADDTDDLRWYLEKYLQFNGAGDQAKARGIEAKLKDWGDQLFKAVFGGEQGTHVYRNLGDAVKNKQPCLVTIGSKDPAVLSQPWEMMRDSKGPLTFQGITIRRQLKGSGAITHHKLPLPLRVLLIVSRPEDVSFIDPRNSILPVLDALDALDGQVRVDFCEPPTLPQLTDMLREAHLAEQPYHIVHFDGHGTYMPKTGVGALCFENDEAKNAHVTGRQLGDLVAKYDVPLVLLEACRGSDLSDRPVFGSLAPALLDGGVGSVIAFSHSVHVEAARIFVERFYKELVRGRSVGQALEEARADMAAQPARFLHLGPNARSIDLEDWFIPQLYQVGADPALVTDGGEAVKAGTKHAKKAIDMSGFPPAPMYKFHGRARELLEIGRAFHKHHAVLLSGMGGMGKTALAREAAAWWRRIGRFDHAVFCSFEQKAGAENVVQIIGKALEGEAFSSRTGEEQWKTAVELFHERKVLVIWDNFESTLPKYQEEGEAEGEAPASVVTFGDEARTQLRKLYTELVADAPEGRLLVTCRPQKTDLPGIKEQRLAGLARPDSLHLLAAVLDVKGVSTDRPGYERHEIDALLDMLDDHSLSIELVAPHLAELKPRKIRTDFGKLLERFENAGAFEARNKSLLASLEFSKKRLSKAAQAVLPYLAWFEGGVFEQFFLDFAELEADAWAAIRAELVSTALVKVEQDVQIENRPYLRFHPTLPFAARAVDVPDAEASEIRFIGVYLAVMQTADEALRGDQPAAGMALMALEEANFRAAMNRAFQLGDRHEGGYIADTLREYLERSGRLRERDALVAWVRGQAEGEELDAAACAAIRDHAWSLFTQGQAGEAVGMVQALIARLETEGLADDRDPAFHVATSNLYLGRILYSAGRSGQALEPLNRAIEVFEQLGDDQRDNLSAALGDRANAYMDLGQLDEALTDAERSLAIDRELGRTRDVAAGLGRIAQIMMVQGRHAEAEARYTEALEAARDAGDLELQGLFLQHQGRLQNDMGHHARAVDLYQLAIAMFQRANDLGGEMQTCGLLGSAEMQRGQLDAAEAWYKRSRELAKQLGDRSQLAATAQNFGILYQTRAKRASDDAERAALLRKAVDSVKECLGIMLELNDQVNAATSYAQLGVLYRELGELDEAERYAMQGLAIRESLNLPDVWKGYANLADIARDRGDADAAAEWQAKYDAKVAELERLARGEGGDGEAPGVPPELVKGILGLAQAAYAARESELPLAPDAAEALATIAQCPPPLNAIAPFLDALASGKAIPPLPAGLPGELEKVLQALAEAIGE